MCDTIEYLKTDILASADADGLKLVERLVALWGKEISEQEAARGAASKVNARVQILKAENRKLKEGVVELERQVAWFNKNYFGSKADHNPNKKDGEADSDPKVKAGEQLRASSTPKDENEKEQSTSSRPRNRKGRGARKWPDHLERVEKIEWTKDKSCPCGCGGPPLNQKHFDRHESSGVIPCQYFVDVRLQPKYRCRATGKIVGTKVSPRLFPHTSMTNALLANAITKRF